jgi:biopolymer transport protein ExbD
MLTENTAFIEFERSRRRGLRELNLTPLIDVLFILIIFFMLTTNYMRIESMELILPSASGNAAEEDGVVHLFLLANGDITIGRRKVGREEMMESLLHMFKQNSGTKIMLLAADGVTTQQLVSAMDRITLAGGKNVLVRKWENAPESAKRKPAPLPKVEEPVMAAPPPEKVRYETPDIRDLYGY